MLDLNMKVGGGSNCALILGRGGAEFMENNTEKTFMEKTLKFFCGLNQNIKEL